MESSANAPAGAGQAMTVRLNVHDARGGALFAPGLQPADAPAPGSMTESISRAMRRFGTRGCAGRRAQQPGGHPGVVAGRARRARQFAAGAAAREATTQAADGAQMNQTGDRVGPAVGAAYRGHRRGELDLGRHCTSRLRAALCARGWTIWPVVRARRALHARHGLPPRCPANCPEGNPLTDEGT